MLFDYNTGSVVIGVGGAVPFSQAPLIVGTAISKISEDQKTNFTDWLRLLVTRMKN